LTSTVYAEKIEVTEHIPIVKPFTKKIKVDERCFDTTIETVVECKGSKDTNSIGIDTVIGSVVGVALGNQIGKGNGNDIAKIVGGVSGAYIANKNRNNNDNLCKNYKTITKCEPIYEYITESKNVGYRNCANYNGKKICKETIEPINYLEISTKIYVH